MLGSTQAKALDHHQRGAVVVFKRKMRDHEVKIFRVVKPFRAEVVDLVRARVLAVQKSPNFRYRVAVEGFDFREFGLGHRGSRVVGKITHVAARKAHGDDVFLQV